MRREIKRKKRREKLLIRNKKDEINKNEKRHAVEM